MRIYNNIPSLTAHRYTAFNSVEQTKSMEKLSSGLRINSSSDDAAGLSISQSMRAQIGALSQASRNVQDGMSLIQTAEGALQEISSMLTRAKELNVQMANGTYSPEDIENTKIELQRMTEEMTNVLDNTKFNGIEIFSGEVTIAASEDGTTGAIVIPVATFTELDTLIAAKGDSSGGATATELVDNAITEMNASRAHYGALQNRFESTFKNLAVTTENLTAAESRIRDTDLASEMATYTKYSVLQQASQAMLAQSNQLPQNVLQLLK